MAVSALIKFVFLISVTFATTSQNVSASPTDGQYGQQPSTTTERLTTLSAVNILDFEQQKSCWNDYVSQRLQSINDSINGVGATSSFLANLTPLMPMTVTFPWTIKLRTDPSTVYVDNDGFTRVEFTSTSDEWHFTTSHFNESNTVTNFYYRSGQQTLGLPFKQIVKPSCIFNSAFCDYAKSSFRSKRLTATTFDYTPQDDPENPIEVCSSLNQTDCRLIMPRELIFIDWKSVEQSASQLGNSISNPATQRSSSLVSFVTTAITFRGDNIYFAPGKYMVIDINRPELSDAFGSHFFDF
jgi:hypothetical protein